jgi:hypothetical protein
MEQVFRPPDYLGDLRSHDDESECAGSARTRLDAEAQRSVRGACASQAQAEPKAAKPSQAPAGPARRLACRSQAAACRTSPCAQARRHGHRLHPPRSRTHGQQVAARAMPRSEPSRSDRRRGAHRGQERACGWEKRIPTDLPEEVGDHGRAQPSAVNSPVLTERLAQPAAQRESTALARQNRPYEGSRERTGWHKPAEGLGIGYAWARLCMSATAWWTFSA